MFPTKKKLITFAVFIVIDIILLILGIIGFVLLIGDTGSMHLSFLIPGLGLVALMLSVILNLVFLIILIPFSSLIMQNLNTNTLLLMIIPFLINAWIYSCAIIFAAEHFNKNKFKKKANKKKKTK